MIPGNEDEDDESRADASGEIRLPATLEHDGPPPPTAEIAIVGGGASGGREVNGRIFSGAASVSRASCVAIGPRHSLP